MAKPTSRKRRAPKRVLALPDLEHAKTAVLNSLTSASRQRTYDHAIREFVAYRVGSSGFRIWRSRPPCDDLDVSRARLRLAAV